MPTFYLCPKCKKWSSRNTKCTQCNQVILVENPKDFDEDPNLAPTSTTLPSQPKAQSQPKTQSGQQPRVQQTPPPKTPNPQPPRTQTPPVNVKPTPQQQPPKQPVPRTETPPTNVSQTPRQPPPKTLTPPVNLKPTQQPTTPNQQPPQVRTPPTNVTPTRPQVTGGKQPTQVVVGAKPLVRNHPRSGGGGTQTATLSEVDPSDAREKTNKMLGNYVNGLDSKSAEERKAASEKTAQSIMSKSPKDIANLTPRDAVILLAALTCYKDEKTGKVPPAQKKALIKFYGSMKMDPEFLADDRERRAKVLGGLVNPQNGIASARENWDETNDIVSNNQKKATLKKIQDLQCNVLNFKANPIIFKSLGDGNSGNCAGKTVTISTNPKDNMSFDEVLDTVCHETTHAYQHDLIAQLDKGLDPKDPRYAQAMLFKMNERAYEGGPTKLTDEEKKDPVKKREHDEAYQAYKNQPLEAHAWKAGNEAPRAFDVKAAALDIGMLSEIMRRVLPKEDAEKVVTLAKKFSEIKRVIDGTDILGDFDELSAKAYEVIKDRALKILQTPHLGPNDFGVHIGTWNKIVNSRISPRDLLKDMMALLRKVMVADRAENDYKALSEEIDILRNQMGQDVPFNTRQSLLTRRNDLLVSDKRKIPDRLSDARALRDDCAKAIVDAKQKETVNV